MKSLIRRIILSIAALSPGVVAVSVQEMAFSLALALLGITGALSVAAAAIAVSPKVGEALVTDENEKLKHASLLELSALLDLRQTCPDPMLVRAHLQDLISPSDVTPGFMTKDRQIAMVLSQIMARWEQTDAFQLSDDQSRELWLVERLLRASPAEAGALANRFTAPNAMLAMRDRVAAIAEV